MPAYCIFDLFEITDPSKMAEYRAHIGPIVEGFGGRYLAVGGPFEVVEGSWRPVYPVILEFPSLEQARRWYDSPEYAPLKKLRLGASRAHAVFVAGL